MIKRIVWFTVTRLAIAIAGYINLDRNIPYELWCEACSDYGKWKRCENCIYAIGGEKKNNFRPKVNP